MVGVIAIWLGHKFEARNRPLANTRQRIPKIYLKWIWSSHCGSLIAPVYPFKVFKCWLPNLHNPTTKLGIKGRMSTSLQILMFQLPKGKTQHRHWISQFTPITCPSCDNSILTHPTQITSILSISLMNCSSNLLVHSYYIT